MDTAEYETHKDETIESDGDLARRNSTNCDESKDGATQNDLQMEQTCGPGATEEEVAAARCTAPELSDLAALIASGEEQTAVAGSGDRSEGGPGPQKSGGDTSSPTQSQVQHQTAKTARPVRFCVSWATGLETVALGAEATIQELQDAVLSAPDVPSQHKRFVYKGRLLEDDERVGDVPLHDGAVVHMLLRESAPAGRFVHVKSIQTKLTRRVRCRPDASVEELKEELAAFPGERAVEEQRVLFAGRELEDGHTLREYNIQKPCVMVALARSTCPRELPAFLAGHFPPKEGAGVAVDGVVSVRFTSLLADQLNTWACMLGSPDIRTVTASELRLLDTNRRPLAGDFSYDEASRIVTFRPLRPLAPASHYRVELNCPPFHRRECLFDPPDSSPSASSPSASSPSASSPSVSSRTRPLPPTTGIFHDRVLERVEGSVSWDFFTAGYVPLRLVSVLPRPCSAVSPENAAVILAFSGPLPPPTPALQMHTWVRVAGHVLKPPSYDAPTLSLVFEFLHPPPPGSICRVHVQAGLVRGSRGEALLPLQPDDLLKTSSGRGSDGSGFRWRFHVEPAPPYQPDNAAASGLAAVWQRWRGGKVAAPSRPRRRGPNPSPLNTSPSSPSPRPSSPAPHPSPPGGGVPRHMVYKAPSQSPGEETDWDDAPPPPPPPRPRVWAPGMEPEHQEGEGEEEAGGGGGEHTPGSGPFVRPGYPISLQVAVSPIVDLWQGAKQLLWQP